MQNQVEKLKANIEAARVHLLAHPVYTKINNLEGLQQFTQYHVFAVWDFMSLLKTLQASLTSVETAWVPTPHKAARRLILSLIHISEPTRRS